MKRKSYYEQLKDSRWQKKRLELLQAADYKCQNIHCNNPEEHPQLSIHHKLYLRDTNIWEYEPWAYKVLCNQCHEYAQSSMERAHIALAKNPFLLSAAVMVYHLNEESARRLCSAMNSISQMPSEIFWPTLNAVDALLMVSHESINWILETDEKQDQIATQS